MAKFARVWTCDMCRANVEDAKVGHYMARRVVVHLCRACAKVCVEAWLFEHGLADRITVPQSGQEVNGCPR